MGGGDLAAPNLLINLKWAGPTACERRLETASVKQELCLITCQCRVLWWCNDKKTTSGY